MAIWVDVSFIRQKVCARGGTTRVLLDLIRGFAREKGVRFCYFDVQHHIFLRTSAAKVLAVHRVFCGRREKESGGLVNRTCPVLLRDLEQATDGLKHQLVSLLRRVRFSHEDTLFFPANWHLHRAEWKCLMALPRGQRPGHMVPFIYDIFYMKNPQYAGQGWCELFREWLDHMLRYASLLLTCSQSTEKDILEYARALGLPVPGIRQVRLPDEIQIDERDDLPQEIPPGFIGPQKYVLYVSTFEIRKNHALLHQVWRMLLRNFREEEVPDLVLAGTPGWLAEDIFADIHRDHLMKGKMKILENVSNNNLARLYQNCFFTVYPSLYEGWGLPVAESLSLGKFCIASRSASIPEIGGDLIDYHDPSDAKDCYDRVVRCLMDPDYVRKKEEQIRQRYQKTTLQAFSNQTLMALREGGRSSRPGFDLPKSFRIYQLFHDKASQQQLRPSEYVVPLGLQPGLDVPAGGDVLNEGPYLTNQLAETRAFYYAINHLDPLKYVGFTTYRHNQKFNCVRIEDLGESLVGKCFQDVKTKLIAFNPFAGFIDHSDGVDKLNGKSRKGFSDVIFEWLKKEYNLSEEQQTGIVGTAKTKYVPYCNAFVMPVDEFRLFFSFIDSFVKYIDKTVGLDAYSLSVPVGRKGREWGEYCERILGFYLLYRYGGDYNIAFIDRHRGIHRLDRKRVFPGEISIRRVQSFLGFGPRN